MIRRFLDALNRQMATQMPDRQFRPNELSREAVRAERLRRETRQARAPQQAAPAPVEAQAGRARPAPNLAPQRDAASLASSLRSRSELRRALLLKEILGRPAALRRHRDDDSAK